MMIIRTDDIRLKFIQKQKRLYVFLYFLKQWRAAIFPHKLISSLAEKKCREIIASWVETSVHTQKPRATLKKACACKKKLHAKSLQNSHKFAQKVHNRNVENLKKFTHDA